MLSISVVETENGLSYSIDSYSHPIFLYQLYGDRKVKNTRWEDIPTSAWNSVSRIDYQNQVRLSGEVIYPTIGLKMLKHNDSNIKQNYFNAYNQWLSSFCVDYSDRLFGIGVVPEGSIEQIVETLVNIKFLGLRGALMSPNPVLVNYASPDYYEVWDMASKLGLPISFHTHSSTSSSTYIPELKWELRSYLTAPRELQNVLFVLVFSGVLEKYPNLKIVFAEADVGWISYISYKMDYLFLNRQEISYNISILPSEIIKRQVYFTYLNEVLDEDLVSKFEQNIMWSNDYPHPDYSAQTFDEIESGLGKGFKSELFKNLIYDNVKSVYGIR